MTETKNNFIAGEWLAGDNSIENRNPSDLSDIIGHFAQASSTQLDKALDAARAAQKIWATTGLEARQTV